MDFAGLGSLVQTMSTIDLNRIMVSSITKPMVEGNKDEEIRKIAKSILKEDAKVTSYAAAYKQAVELYNESHPQD